MNTNNRNSQGVNWRAWIIIALSFVCAILLMSDTDNTAKLIAIKLVAFALMYVVFRLGRMWREYT